MSIIQELMDITDQELMLEIRAAAKDNLHPKEDV